MNASSAMPNLPPAAAREVFRSLISTLPLPVVDCPKALLARDESALAALAALRPANVFEALLATHIVAFDAHAKECFRLAAEAGRNAETARHWHAQAAAMMGVMQSWLRSLQRTQALREKAAAAAVKQAGRRFRDAPVPPAAESPGAGIGYRPASLRPKPTFH